jgi:glycosyltransferase involved in cell wall biosynthesis
MDRLGLPVVVEYEDDAIVEVDGNARPGWRAGYYVARAREILRSASGAICVSPHMISRFPDGIPKVLLRGVVDEDIVRAGQRPSESRPNRVAFSGTHFRTKGLVPLIAAWHQLNLPGWELHIAGRGELTAAIEEQAAGNKTIVFHGLLNRAENARFLSEAKIGINPHDLSATPGNVFAFKIIEYLAAGAHCITTPMGTLEPELEAGITYMPDNSPATIAKTLEHVIRDRAYEKLATSAAIGTYGPDPVAASLDSLLKQVAGRPRTGAPSVRAPAPAAS